MTSFFKLTLDTTPPEFTAEFAGAITGLTSVDIIVSCLEALENPNLQIKIWGDVDPSGKPAIQPEKEDAEWVAFGEENVVLIELLLSEGDGAKVIHVAMRDDVWNEDEHEASIELDTSIPVITITAGPSAAKISEISGKDTTTFTFKANEPLVAWEVKVVPTEGSSHENGFVIPQTEGSVTEGGALEPETNQEAKILGEDLASAVGGDGEYIIKVFGFNAAGNWSV